MPPVPVRVHAAGTDPVLVWDRTWTAAETIVPWLSTHVSLDGASVFEYGCGDGQASRAFALHARRVHGVDIDAAAIARGRRALEEDEVGNVTLEAHAVEDIVHAMRAEAGRHDVVLLYAVVEHLSIDERLEVLEAARAVARPRGVIVCVEAPNRLASFDAHSSQLPYFNWLPHELARRYVDRSTRADLHAARREAIAAGPAAERDWWVRFGTGVSFHEFELVFGDLSRHVLAGGYETVMWPGRPLQPEEPLLARDLARQRPDLGPAWSRQWLDVVLAPDAVEGPPRRFVWPWTMDMSESQHASFTRWNSIALPGPEAVVRVRPERPTRRIVAGFIAPPGEAVLTVAAGDDVVAEARSSSDVEMRTRYVEVAWHDETPTVDLRLHPHGHVLLVACEY